MEQRHIGQKQRQEEEIDRYHMHHSIQIVRWIDSLAEHQTFLLLLLLLLLLLFYFILLICGGNISHVTNEEVRAKIQQAVGPHTKTS